MSNWYLIIEKSPLSGIENMAVDEHLYNLCHQTKTGFLRLYQWEKPTFSLGASQRHERAVDMNYIQDNHHPMVRRLTGGKTVLHDDELTYSVASSEDVFFKDNDIYQSYKLIAIFLMNSLKKHDIPAYLSSQRSSTLARSNNPCFSFPTLNEIEVGGKKVIGSAQKRDKHALLQHGSIPFSMNYELYAKGTGSNSRLIQRSMTTLNDIKPLSMESLKQSMIDSFENLIHNQLSMYQYNEGDYLEIERLKEKYASSDWNLSL